MLKLKKLNLIVMKNNSNRAEDGKMGDGQDQRSRKAEGANEVRLRVYPAFFR